MSIDRPSTEVPTRSKKKREGSACETAWRRRSTSSCSSSGGSGERENGDARARRDKSPSEHARHYLREWSADEPLDGDHVRRGGRRGDDDRLRGRCSDGA